MSMSRTRIYTRGGDGGETGLIGGGRVPKNSPRVEACGAVDELNAALGCVRNQVPEEIGAVLVDVQHDLFDVGACLADPRGDFRPRLDVSRLEATIDRFDAELAEIKQFILPGGAPPAAALHFARTICRRAERRVVALGSRECTAYLNRLSDLLFVLARSANRLAGVGDVPWEREKPF